MGTSNANDFARNRRKNVLKMGDDFNNIRVTPPRMYTCPMLYHGTIITVFYCLLDLIASWKCDGCFIVERNNEKNKRKDITAISTS